MHYMTIILTIIILVLLTSTFFLIHMINELEQLVEREKNRVYREAIRVFYEWKNEIGWVSLRGVGANYEKWIEKKMREAGKK